jgi:hypothetical protein
VPMFTWGLFRSNFCLPICCFPFCYSPMTLAMISLAICGGTSL